MWNATPSRQPVALAALLALAALAGCAGEAVRPQAAGDNPAGDTSAADAPDLPLNGTGPSPLDPWAPDETHRVLFEGDVIAGQDCNVNNYLGTQAAFTALGGYASSGCGVFTLPADAHILRGSLALRIEADATQALKAGGFNVHYWSHSRTTQEQAEGTPSTSPVATFAFPLKPVDWEPAAPTTATFWFWPQGGPVNVLEGPISTRVVLEKDVAWTPAATMDHWNMTGMHQVVQAGVMTLIDATIDWNEPALANGNFPTAPPLQGIIPTGTRFIVLGIQWTPMSNCPPAPAFGCRMFSDIRDGDRVVTSFGGPIREADDSHAIIVWDSPQQVPWDDETAETSRVSINPYALVMCHVPFETTCGRPPGGTTTTVRFVMEAWSIDVDLAAVAARLDGP